MASRINTKKNPASLKASKPLAIGLTGFLLLAGQQAQAQDPLSLEDLIPDSAVENPEAWAQDPDAAQSDGQPSQDGEPLLPSAPMAEMPELSVEWPDYDRLELPPFEQLEPEQDMRLAEEAMPDLMIMPAADLVRVNSALVLAFPTVEEAFPIREEFIDRFEVLSTIEELSDGGENIAQLVARARADQSLLAEMLRTYGYYDAQVIRTIGPASEVGTGAGAGADNQGSVRFDIIPGQRYQFGNIDLGLLRTAPDFDALRAAFGIETGDPLSSDGIVAQELNLGVALGEAGYPFAKIGEAELLIDHRSVSGDLSLPVDPAGKYAFGEVVSSLPNFLSGKHLSSIARFDSGDLYSRSMELDLRRAITATGLVSAVNIIPREVVPPTPTTLGKVALDVELTKAPLRTIAGAIGYGSEEGYRLEASWEHRNLFPAEGALKVRGILGTQEQLAGVTFRKNNFGGRDRVLTLDTYVSTIDSDAFDARTLAFVANYERVSTLLFQKPLSWSVGFEAVVTSERPAMLNNIIQPRETFFVGALPVSALIDTTDDLLNPKKGFRLGARLSPEISRNDGVQSFYLRAQIDASYYKSVTDRLVIAGRTRLGSIPGTDISNIAPSRRYYSGGGGSVRGYGYQKIGPTDTIGDPTGGLSLVEFSLEARVQTGFMDGAVSIVPFVDAGSVSTGTTPDFKNFKVGAGLGLRYDTGFGPIRVDVGVPLNPEPRDSPVAAYVSLGQAF